MPRKSRIDAPGALHHIIAKGIDRAEIFRDDPDRDDFLERLGKKLTETGTACYAWALIPNHFHLLLQTGTTPISAFMGRLLTGYAARYNRRHRRKGHLFQNRFKSILCQEDSYLLELVRYIHLNPLRAGIIDDFDALAKYPYSGHSRLLGRYESTWQDVTYVLKLFGDSLRAARKRYQEFVADGVAKGERRDLGGGGLVRSAGGWSAVKKNRRAGEYQKGDERILGDGDFVEAVLRRAEETFKAPFPLYKAGLDFSKVLDRAATFAGLKPAEILQGGRSRPVAQARCLVCFWAVKDLGMSQTELANRLNISQPAIGKAVNRGRGITESGDFSFTAD